MAVTNQQVVQMLRELAVLTELEEGSPQAFRVRAYHNAERAVAGLGRDVATMSADELSGIKGIGTSIAAKIRELVDTGTVQKLEDLRARHPPGQRELLRIPGIGAKTVALLRDELGVTDLDGLTAAIDEQRLRDVPGLGERTEQNVAKAIDRLGLGGREQRIPIAEALPVAERMVAELGQCRGVEQVAHAGSLRRFRETIGDIDLLAAAADAAAVMDAFAALPDVREVQARGGTKSTVLTATGLQVDLRVVRPGHLGAAMVYFTGSKAHNIRLRERAQKHGLTLNEYALTELDTGAVVASETEQDVYAALDLPWIAPELREDNGEVEAAAAGELPELVEVGHLRGDLHDHTTLSGDGRVRPDELVAAAADRGLAYLAVTDHAEDLHINGASRQQMLDQRDTIRGLGSAHPDLHLLHGAELNIGPDGGLDYDRDFLLGFDWCVASVHSHFRLDRDRQTRRVVAAMRHPAVHAIGHLTGRRIGKRPGIELHVDAVVEAAAATGTAIEINGNLDRLDASAEVLRHAVEAGCVFTVASDAHSLAELDNLAHGVRQARRGWVPRDRIVNTWDRRRFLAWVEDKPGRVA